MPSIFLSHSSKDRDFTQYLARGLAKAGIRVWVDQAELNIGDSLIERIGAAILEMDFFGIVLSKHSIGSEWVQRELRVALTREFNQRNVLVLPILLEDVLIPPFLQDKVYADFRSRASWELMIAKLVVAVSGSSDLGKLNAKQPLPLSENRSFQARLAEVLRAMGGTDWHFPPTIPARVLEKSMQITGFYDSDNILCIPVCHTQLFRVGETAFIFSRVGLHFGRESIRDSMRYEEFTSNSIEVKVRYESGYRRSSPICVVSIKGYKIEIIDRAEPLEIDKAFSMIKFLVADYMEGRAS